MPDPAKGDCVKPFHDRNDQNSDAPHGAPAAVADVDGRKMDGFIAQAGTSDVMGYHEGREIPNYWAYAREFVLHDHMFEPNASWSLPEHLFQVSEWSALCTKVNGTVVGTATCGGDENRLTEKPPAVHYPATLESECEPPLLRCRCLYLSVFLDV